MAGNARRNNRSSERFRSSRKRRAQRPFHTKMTGRAVGGGELGAALRRVGELLWLWVLERRWLVMGVSLGLVLLVAGLVVSPRITISVVLAATGLLMLALDRYSRKH